jgi:hypothetical protein
MLLMVVGAQVAVFHGLKVRKVFMVVVVAGLLGGISMAKAVVEVGAVHLRRQVLGLVGVR